MAKNLLNFEPNPEIAVKTWQNSQFEIADIVLSLTDNKQKDAGLKLYSLFQNESFLQLMHIYTCDFKAIKTILGIKGEYVERKGDVYSNTFNPKRRNGILTLDSNEMGKRGLKIFDALMAELEVIAKEIQKKIEE